MKSDERDVVFLKILADSTRMTILYFLKNGEKSFKQIMHHLEKSQSIVSTNLKLLTQESLVESRTESGSKYFKIRNPNIFPLLQHISSFVTEKEQEKILTRSTSEAQDIL